MILHPIENQHRRVTQYFWENFEYNWKPYYWPGGQIPNWQYHLGVDFSSRENGNGNVTPLPIRAWVYGRVEYFVDPGKWNMVALTWEEYYIEYIHLDSFEGKNREVFPWDIIGYTGNTGKFTTAAHLHMDVRRIINGKIDRSWPDYGMFDFYDLLVEEVPLTAEQLRIKYNVPYVYKWVSVEISTNPLWKYNAIYDWKLNKMVIYPRWFKKDELSREAILLHEFMHYIMIERLPRKWLKQWYEYAPNYGYVSEYAKKNPLEDASECIEEYFKAGYKLIWDDSTNEKVVSAVKIFNRYCADINKLPI